MKLQWVGNAEKEGNENNQLFATASVETQLVHNSTQLIKTKWLVIQAKTENIER